MESEGFLSNLPLAILIDILSRLPVKTFFRCPSVCKTWPKLLSDPEFVHLHLARSPTQFLINKNFITPCFNLVEVQDESDHHDLQYNAETEMEITKSRPHTVVTIIGSINGLVCLTEFQYQYDDVHIWNPTMRECIIIETPGGERAYPKFTSYGFGFSSVKGYFHVVCIFQKLDKNDSEGIRKSECHVYMLGTGSWRSIGHAPFLYNCREHGIFLNGNLHWLIHNEEGSEFISCLNLKTELFRPFPSPPELGKNNLAMLNTYGGCVSVCDNTSDFNIIVWLMKECGVKNSSSKEAGISKYPIDLIGNYYEVVHVIKVFKDGEILLIWRDD